MSKCRKVFFQDCDLVVRTPVPFFFSGEHTVEVGQPALLVLTDFWVWVGVRFHNEKEFKGTVVEVNPSAPIYDSPNLDFEKDYIHHSNLNKGLKNSIEKLCQSLKQWSVAEKTSTFDFYVFTESPFAVGMNTSSALCTCLGMIMHFLEMKARGEEITPKDLNDISNKFKKAGTNELKDDPAFSRIFTLSRFCADIMVGYHTCGAPQFASMLRTTTDSSIDNPGQMIFYFTQPRGPGTSSSLTIGTKNYQEHTDYIKKMEYFGFRVKMPHWMSHGYAISLFYCGSRTNYPQIHSDLITWHRFRIEKVSEIIDKHLGKSIYEKSNLVNNPLKLFLNTKNHNERRELIHWPLHAYCSILGTIAIRMLEEMLSPENEATRFIELIIDNNKMLNSFGVLRGPMRTFKKRFREKIFPAELETSLNSCYPKITGVGNGGNLIVFGQKHDMRIITNYFTNTFVPTEREKLSKKLQKNNSGNEHIGPQLHCTSLDDDEFVPRDKNTVYYPNPNNSEAAKKIIFKVTTQHPKATISKLVNRRLKKGQLQLDFDNNDNGNNDKQKRTNQEQPKIVFNFGRDDIKVSSSDVKLYPGSFVISEKRFFNVLARLVIKRFEKDCVNKYDIILVHSEGTDKDINRGKGIDSAYTIIENLKRSLQRKAINAKMEWFDSSLIFDWIESKKNITLNTNRTTLKEKKGLVFNYDYVTIRGQGRKLEDFLKKIGEESSNIVYFPPDRIDQFVKDLPAKKRRLKESDFTEKLF